MSSLASFGRITDFPIEIDSIVGPVAFFATNMSKHGMVTAIPKDGTVKFSRTADSILEITGCKGTLKSIAVIRRLSGPQERWGAAGDSLNTNLSVLHKRDGSALEGG